jgi:hypothetical protein
MAGQSLQQSLAALLAVDVVGCIRLVKQSADGLFINQLIVSDRLSAI